MSVVQLLLADLGLTVCALSIHAWTLSQQQLTRISLTAYFILLGLIAFARVPVVVAIGFLFPCALLIEISHAYRRGRLLGLDLNLGEYALNSLRSNAFFLLVYGIYLVAVATPTLLASLSQWVQIAAMVFAVLGGLFLMKTLSPALFGFMQRTEELRDPDLLELVHTRLKQVGLPKLRVDVWHIKKFKSVNAMVMGMVWLPKPLQARIVISDSLISDFRREELDAILAHEVAHVHQNHIAKRMWLPFTAFLGVALAALILSFASASSATILVAALVVPFTYIFCFVYLARELVRAQELDADWLALNHFRVPAELYFNTLDRMTLYNGESLNRRNPLQFLNVGASHPTAEERRHLVTRAPTTGTAPFERALFLRTWPTVTAVALLLALSGWLFQGNTPTAAREPAAAPTGSKK